MRTVTSTDFDLFRISDDHEALREAVRAVAEDKIARAEAQAVGEVRGAAVDVAVAAAERILAEKSGSGALVDQAIRDLKTRLN